MTKFQEGQEVEVANQTAILPSRGVYATEWRKAKIVRLPHAPNALDDGRKYTVQFRDGLLAVFDAAHIRAIEVLSPLDYAAKYGPGHVIE